MPFEIKIASVPDRVGNPKHDSINISATTWNVATAHPGLGFDLNIKSRLAIGCLIISFVLCVAAGLIIFASR